ncbi:unnamed protein product, partial [Rotaria sp. Silwood1]
MSPILSINIDIDVDLVDAHIFTPGQGICLKKLSGSFNKDTCTIIFKKKLAYGSWYDVLIRVNRLQKQQSYMKKGIYLMVNKFVQLSKILHKKNRINPKNKPQWQFSSLISCYSCPFDINSFDYIVTANNFPSELKNCSLITNMTMCAVQIVWNRDPDNTKITLVAEDIRKSVSTEHNLIVNVGYENQENVPKWEKVLTYECITDQCNSLTQLKRLINSLIMNDTLYELSYLLNPVKPFQGEWCYRNSNASFEKCDTTISNSSCKQCILHEMINQTNTELCATCSIDNPVRTEFAHGMTFNMIDRTNSTVLIVICQRKDCNIPTVGDIIRNKSYIYFDFDEFLNTVQPEPDYDNAVKFLKNYAEELDLEYRLIKIDEDRQAAVLTWLSSSSTDKSLLLNSHIDVVPVFEENWIVPPFSGEIRDGKIYGRGTQDMKCVGIQYLEAIRRL